MRSTHNEILLKKFQRKDAILFLGFILLGPFCPLYAQSQRAASQGMFIDYNGYFTETFKNFTSVKPGFRPKSLKEIQGEAALLKEEMATAEKLPVINGRSKTLTDEAIFTERKNSVFIIGKLQKSNDSTGVKFDLTGTAFAIAKDGICATNYHVLQDIIHANGNTNDSVYFIMTSDRKIYFVDSILAYTQNNDIAVFKVDTRGDKLSPVPLGEPLQVGASVFCLSHPLGRYYYFSKGILSRNVAIDSAQAAAGYSSTGKPPIRMEITADYGLGSSGGPILDKHGNLVGIVSSTATLNDAAGRTQMVVKETIPVIALRRLVQGR